MLTDNDIQKLKEVLATKEDIDTLTAMVKRGFDATASKAQLAEFQQNTKENFDHVHARLSLMERDIKDLVHQDEFEDLMARVKYVETKLGIESGK